MNIMELVIQVLKPCCAMHVMCILSHVEVLKLVENHSLKLGVCMFSILKWIVQLNCHWLRFIFDEGMTTSLEAPSRRITRSMSRGESSIPSPLSLFCITLV